MIKGMPKKVKVGPITYKIKLVSDDHELLEGAQYGACDREAKTIYVNKTQGQVEAKHTLLHEVFHALYFESQTGGIVYTAITSYNEYNNQCVEELIVTNQTSWWLMLMSENKDLVRWVSS